MDETMKMKLKKLRLWGLLERWDEHLAHSRKSRLSAERLLRHIIDEEYRCRQERALAFRLKRARIPEPYVMATYPFAKQPRLDRRKVLGIYDSFEYIEKKRNLVFCGPTSVGKSGLATAYLTQAIERGSRGRFVKFAELVAELYASIADHTQEKLLRRYAKFDCLLIDEMGYIEIEPTQAGMFFTLMQKRHKRRTTIVTSNLGFSDWNSLFKNEHLTAALLARLTETSYVFNMSKCRPIRDVLEKKS
jgi:DNA replication protein DnaC